jgi:hypothetical protein
VEEYNILERKEIEEKKKDKKEVMIMMKRRLLYVETEDG